VKGESFLLTLIASIKLWIAFCGYNPQCMGAALKASSLDVLLDRYVLCWTRFSRFADDIDCYCHKLHTNFVYNKQKEGKKDIWEVMGLVMYHWKVDVIDADPRLLDTALEYIEAHAKDLNTWTSKRDWLLESFGFASRWIELAECDKQSGFLSDGAQTLDGEFIEADWFMNDEKWVRMVESEQELLPET